MFEKNKLKKAFKKLFKKAVEIGGGDNQPSNENEIDIIKKSIEMFIKKMLKDKYEKLLQENKISETLLNKKILEGEKILNIYLDKEIAKLEKKTKKNIS